MFLLGFGIGLAVAGDVCFCFAESARSQVAIRAKLLMMESSLAARIFAYTNEQIKPMVDHNDPVFHPQTVLAYAATSNFNYFRKATRTTPTKEC